MIDRIHVPALNLTVPLGPFCVLVGVNGCGKTTVLGAINDVHRYVAWSTHRSREERVEIQAIAEAAVPQRRSGGSIDAWTAVADAMQARRLGVPLTIDNLGATLHPTAAGRLVATLRTIGAQVIATTHSPDVVDAFAGDEVLVLHDGKAARLSQHPEWAKWSTLTRTGEFWSTVGEAWVADVKGAE